MSNSVAAVHSHCCTATTSIQLQNISITPKQNPLPTIQFLPISTFLSGLSNHQLAFCIYGFISSGYFIWQTESYNMWYLGFSHLVYFGGSSTWQLQCLLYLNNISLYIHTTIFLSIYLPFFLKHIFPMVSGTLYIFLLFFAGPTLSITSQRFIYTVAYIS